MPDPSPKARAVDLGPPTDASAAEIRLARDRLWLTVWLPQVSLREAHILLEAASLRILGPSIDLRYALPAAVVAGHFVARQRNGVIDVMLERKKNTH